MDAGMLAGTIFPATKADAAAGSEEGRALADTYTAEEGGAGDEEYPVPILGVKEGVVIVVVDKDTEEDTETPRNIKFSDCNLD